MHRLKGDLNLGRALCDFERIVRFQQHVFVKRFLVRVRIRAPPICGLLLALERHFERANCARVAAESPRQNCRFTERNSSATQHQRRPRIEDRQKRMRDHAQRAESDGDKRNHEDCHTPFRFAAAKTLHGLPHKDGYNPVPDQGEDQDCDELRNR